jgi:predicted enzyme related to lactoylglutathione lyase
MINGYAYMTLLVNNQDEAVAFYQEKIGLEVRQDVPFGPDIRWVTVAPKEVAYPEISLSLPSSEATKAAVGKQTGDYVTLVLTTTDADAFHAKLKGNGVNVISEPENVPWGRFFSFKDLYGNTIDVLQPAYPA